MEYGKFYCRVDTIRDKSDLYELGTFDCWMIALSDNTDEVVASFKDKRIRYFKNKKNSGAA